MVRRCVGARAYARRMGGRRGSPSVVAAGVAVSTALGTALGVALGGVALITGCGARPPAAPAATAGDEIALYRDRAVVAQRVVLDAARAGPAAVPLRLPAGVDPAAVQVL